MSNFEYWYHWYPSRFRADTMHLTAEQDGIYRRLIDHYMETRLPLPDNDVALARIASVSIDIWKMAAAILRPYFKHSDGMLHLKKCDETLSIQAANSAKQIEKGKKGASARWLKNKDKNATAIAQAMPNDAREEKRREEESREVSKKEKTPIGVKKKFEIPDWMPIQLWEDFMSVRKAKKAPPTDRALKILVGILEKAKSSGQSIEAILEQSISRGYTGLFPIKEIHQTQPIRRNVGVL